MRGFKKPGTRIVFVVALLLICISSGAALAANKLIVKDSAGTTDKFVVTDGGYVGLGTNAPSAGQHLKGTTIPSTQIITQYTGPNTGAGFTGSGGFVAFRNEPNGELPLAGDRLGYILFGALDCSSAGSIDGCTPKYSSGFFAYADGNWSSTSVPSYYAFETTPAGKTQRNEWLRITSSGNIGIGNPSPTTNLEVNGGLRINAQSVPATSTSPARTAPAKPACDSSNGPNIRGTLWYTKGGVGVADVLEVCAKQSSENYAWRPLF